MAELPIDDVTHASPLPTSSPAPAPSIADQKREVARTLAGAQRQLFARLHEATRRIEHAKESLDVAKMIGRHPLAAVGIGLATGALAGLHRADASGTLPGRAGALIGGVVLHVLKERLATWASGLAAASAGGPAPATP